MIELRILALSSLAVALYVTSGVFAGQLLMTPIVWIIVKCSPPAADAATVDVAMSTSSGALLNLEASRPRI